MKQTHLFLSLASVITLASCGGLTPSTSSTSSSAEQSCSACEPCPSVEPTKMTYGHYTLKDSVKDLAEIEGYPWINSDIAGMLAKVEKPEAKHDFFGHANYERFLENPLPEDTKRAGGKIFESKDVTDEHIEEILSSEDASVKAVLQMLKTGAKDKILADVADLLDSDKAATSAKAILKSKAIFEGPSKLVEMQVDESKNVHISFRFSIQNVNLPVVLYLASATQKIQEYFDALVSYLKLVGLDEETAGNLFNSSAAAVIPAIVAQAKATPNPHETTIGQMDYNFGNIDLKAALLDLGFAESTQVTMSDQAFLYLTALGGVTMESLANTLAFSRMFDNRFFVGAANYRDLALNHFAGLQALEDDNISEDDNDDKVAESIYLEALPKAFDQVYINKFIKTSTKDRIDGLIEDIIDVYREIFDQQEWLSEETKQAAKDKLNNMWHMSFYSDGFMDQKNLFKVTATDALTLAGDYYQWYTDIMKSCPWSGNLLTTVFSTTTVNAMYSPTDNSFAIYHGVCSSYIEDENLSTEKLYGYIGMVIGHEISHGFDSNGSNFDKNGQKSDWWTAEDKEAFQSKVGKIANYYTNDLHGYHDHNYRGENLTGEIIADMGGARVMLRLAEKQESFNYDEFFRAVAENFAIQGTREHGIQRITSDNHPEEYLRINVTLSQFDEFAKTYNIKEGDGMYVDPANRLAIW
ncbi:MAG: hypothetical protein II721_04090 [Bacilli bacterium]|nr:hypothetical protein [Bacilli bacterium]